MSEERDKVRCRSCELVQWSDRANCRRCGTALPEPIVRIVERVVEKVVIRQDPQCLQKLEQASRLISTATERLTQQYVESVAPIVLAQVPETGVFLTMAEVERALICLSSARSVACCSSARRSSEFAHLNWPTCTSPDVRIRGWTGGSRWNFSK